MKRDKCDMRDIFLMLSPVLLAMTDGTRTPNRRTFLAGVGSVMIASALAGCNSGPGGDNGSTTGTGADTESDTTQEPQTTTAASDGITKQQAGQIATDRVGGTVLNVEKDSTDGTPVYEVEITRENGIDKEVDVARHNGDIVAIENETRDTEND